MKPDAKAQTGEKGHGRGQAALPLPAASMKKAPRDGESFRSEFPGAVEDLKRRRADLLSPGTIDAYVDAEWLEWSGGTLKLTIVGANICAQLRKEALFAAKA